MACIRDASGSSDSGRHLVYDRVGELGRGRIPAEIRRVRVPAQDHTLDGRLDPCADLRLADRFFGHGSLAVTVLGDVNGLQETKEQLAL